MCGFGASRRIDTADFCLFPQASVCVNLADSTYLIFGLWGTGGLRSEVTAIIVHRMGAMTVNASIEAYILDSGAAVIGMIFFGVSVRPTKPASEVGGTCACIVPEPVPSALDSHLTLG